MITLAEIREYLGITDTEDTSKDAYLKGVIPKAISKVESYLNRNLQSADYVQTLNNNCFLKSIYLDNGPVNSISAIKKITTDFTEEDIILSPNTIADSVGIDGNKVTLYKGYYFSSTCKVSYNGGYIFRNLTGTVATTVGNADVTGTGTDFENELSVGDFIIIGSERKQITVITDATHLTVSDTYTYANTGVVAIRTNLPEIIRQAILETAVYIYNNSYQGDSLLMVNSKTDSNGVTSNTVNFKNLDLSYIERYIEYSI